MIYFIAYIILVCIFAGIFYCIGDSEKDSWIMQSFFWPVILLVLIGVYIGEKLK